MKLLHCRPLGALLLITAPLWPACQCDGTNVNNAEPHANAARTLDLGSVAVGLTSTRNLYVANDGTDTLHINNINLEGDGASQFSVAASGTDVVPHAATTLVVTFRPTAEGAAAATLVLLSNAHDNPTLRVALTGNGLPPAITVEPLALNFDTVLPGQFKQLPLTLRNNTDQDVNATLYAVDDATSAFSLEGSAVGGQTVVRVVGGMTSVVQVRFAPNRGGMATGNLRVDSCGVACGVVVPLTGVMAAPRIDVSPIVLDFGRVASGMQVDQPVTLGNLGSLPLTISAGTLSEMNGAFSLVDAFPVTLMPMEHMDFHLRYNAVLPGRSETRLTLDSNDPSTPQAVVLLVGSTSGSDVVALPGAINLGSVPNGNVVSRDVMILNRGDQEAHLEGLQLTSTQFSLDNNGLPPLPYLLGPGSSLVLTVHFSSSPLGTFNAVMQITTDSPGHEMLSVAMEATRADRLCNVVASTAEVNLGSIRLGQQAGQSFTVRNIGTGVCNVTPPVPAPGFANSTDFVFSGDGGDLAPGDLRRVNIRFTPSVRGALRAVVQLAVSGSPPILVTARGRGSAAGVSVNPTFLDFGAVPINCMPATKTISVLSDGADAVPVDAPTVSPTPPFTVSAPGFPASLPPGTGLSLSVTFAPTVLGVVTGQTRIVGHVPDEDELLVGLRGEGVPTSTPVTETFTVDTNTAMDVLFVVDNSGSMEDNQENLSANVSRFIQVADFRASVDFQLGVTTTDVTPEGAHGTLLGSPPIIRRGGSAESEFETRARPGVDGSGDEQGLEAARLAFSPPVLDGANVGFLRDQAGLAIVIVSDEEDHSPLDVAQYVNFFQGLKAVSGAPVIISAISGQPMGCATAEAESRYEAAVTSTGGISASICDPDWGTKLQQIGEAALLARGRFRLTGTPQPGTIVVKLDGTVLSSGWSFDASSNSVILEPTSVPAPGSHVTITYVPQC